MILAGASFLLINLGLSSGIHWWSVSRGVMLPLLLISVGAFLIFVYMRRGDVRQAPAGMAPDRIKLLYGEIQKIVTSADMKKFLDTQGAEPWLMPMNQLPDLLPIMRRH